MSECGKLRKDYVLNRASLRGLKICTTCGYINGQRSLICRNVKCGLRKKRLDAIKPFDPIQLVTYDRTKLYSLRSKEKLLHPRIFVSITDSVGLLDSNRNAVCYVDNCKYDTFDPPYFVCKHVNACKSLNGVTQAEVYSIDKNILWNLNIPLEKKKHLWNLYLLDEKQIHPIQKLNASTFVVKCVESKMFPAGRLHVTVFSNKFPNKNGKFSCSCKKLKIILEPDNSVTMQQEICDHLLLLLAAILNKADGKLLYGRFLDLFQHLWMPTSLNTPIGNCPARSSQFTNYELSLEKCKANCTLVKETMSHNSDDIFNYTEELFTYNNIPDFSDIILDSSSEQNVSGQQFNNPMEPSNSDMHIYATSKNTEHKEDLNLNPLDIEMPEPLHSPTAVESDLSVVEQFQQNKGMQVTNDNIELQPTNKLKSFLNTLIVKNNNDNTVDHEPYPHIVSKPATALAMPFQKSIVITQAPVKVVKIPKPITGGQKLSFSKYNQNEASKQLENNLNVTSPIQSPVKNINQYSPYTPFVSYESWLDHVIEVLNDSIVIQDNTSIKNTFNVQESIFSHFCETFSLNNKRRLPNTTTVIKSGKYKDHIKYAWHFHQASTVERIFSGKNIKIELERSFRRLNDGSFELYCPTYIKLLQNSNFRPICPKVHIYKVFLLFSNTLNMCLDNLQPKKCGLKLEWLPSAFPKSNFGIMTIEFCISIKKPET